MTSGLWLPGCYGREVTRRLAALLRHGACSAWAGALELGVHAAGLPWFSDGVGRGASPVRSQEKSSPRLNYVDSLLSEPGSLIDHL